MKFTLAALLLALPALGTAEDVRVSHAKAELKCVDCHGSGAIAKIKRSEVTKTCARCHAEQLKQYTASVHWAKFSKGETAAATCLDCHGSHETRKAPTCESCHATLKEMYDKSPHAKAFERMQLGGCVGCHGNHEIAVTSSAMLAGDKSLCADCHPAGTGPSKMGALLQSKLDGLHTSLQKSAEILERARTVGMEVSDSLVKLQEANQTQVQARVAVHSLRVEDVDVPVKEGLQAAGQLYKEGEAALRERDKRRMGLVVSLSAILLTIVGLWLRIRKLENHS